MNMIDDTSEPELKRQKMDYNDLEEKYSNCLEKLQSISNLDPIISDDYHQTVPLVKVVTGTIKNPKDISRTILTLNDKMPLKELQHLKRVRKKEIILCLADSMKGFTIEEYINEVIPNLQDVFESFKELEVPSLNPKVRKQFERCNSIWPCNFHPNKYNEKLVSGCFFSKDDVEVHKEYMRLAFEVSKFYTRSKSEYFEESNAAIVVDPSLQSVVAVSFDNRQNHPMQHAAMLAIDNVAKTQNGGAWNKEPETRDSTLQGIDNELLCYLKELFPQLKFGAKMFKSKREMTAEELSESSDTGPYLCTNYYIYMLKEPCIMCSMALVHARVKRVFFCYDNLEHGGLKSQVKLQTVSSLNHHFEVFTGFCEN